LDNRVLSSGEISRSDFINEVRDLMRKSRGRELPGTFNPLLIGELFTEQCRPWRGIAVDTKDVILQAVYRVTQVILDHIAAEGTVDSIFRIVSEGIDRLKSDLNRKVTELLNPHYNGHPITYNNYLTDNVQKSQSDRRRNRFEKTLEEVIGTGSIQEGREYRLIGFKLLTLLEQRTDADMERYSSDLAVDYMQAYYKVSACGKVQ